MSAELSQSDYCYLHELVRGLLAGWKEMSPSNIGVLERALTGWIFDKNDAVMHERNSALFSIVVESPFGQFLYKNASNLFTAHFLKNNLGPKRH